MKEEVARIMKLVQDGKLSPEDAAELIDAFQESRGRDTEAAAEGSSEAVPPPPPPPDAPKDPLKGLVDMIEGLGREMSTNVNWTAVGDQIRQGTQKGVEALRKVADEVTSGNFFGTQETREISMPIAVAEGKTLRIENPAGDILVAAGKDEGAIRASIQVRGANLEEAKERANALQLMLEESEHTVLLKVPRVANLTADLQIDLTVGCAVEIITDSGDVNVSQTGRGGKFTSRSGDLNLEALYGPIEVSMMSGDILIRDSESPMVSLECKSGDVRLEQVRGSVNARVASGDLAVQRWTGKTLSVESVSGDVRVELAEPPTGSINVRTVNGDANISIPDGGDCRVSLSTLRGDVTCGVELADLNQSEQRVTGRIGDGNGTLDVSGINGDILLNYSNRTYVAE